MFDTIWHRWLRVPYTLHVYRQSVVKKPVATLVFMHGIGGSARVWDEVISRLRRDVNVVAVDLLGYGDSPRPDWAKYDAATQAKALAKTLLGLGITQPVTLVGHSMGGLVAVEFARRYPLVVRSLIICSPPLYNVDSSNDKKLFALRDTQLRRLYEFAIKNPKNIVRVSKLAKRYKLLHPEFDVDNINLDNYILSLRANILNQTTAHDIIKIKRPIHILYGLLDPFVIGENIQNAAQSSVYIKPEKFVGGHEVIGRYVGRVLKAIDRQLEEKTA